MGSPLVMPPVARAKALNCPNCGGPIDFRTFGATVNVVCPQCTSILDSSNQTLRVLQAAQDKQNRRRPVVPLGSRGVLKGVTWEVIGFQTRGVTFDDETFEWEEYLLFNPYKGYRYLTNYQGHWNFVLNLEPLPTTTVAGVRPVALFEGHTYKHFSSAQAETSFVLGEFPWQVRSGEKVQTNDYVDPPLILSSESNKNEVTWSQGEYISGAEIWKAFNLAGSAPAPQGIYLNQPSPYTGKVGGIWKMFLLMEGLLLVLLIAFAAMSKNEVVVDERHRFSTLDQSEPSFVTNSFNLNGRAAPVEVEVDTDLSNNSAYFNFALVNEDTGQGYDFAKEVSYYFGSDSDGSWSEGQNSEKLTIPAVPPGRYYLRVEPEMGSETPVAKAMSYHLILRHDSPSYIWFVLAAALLLIPPVWYSIRAKSFELKRWNDSDYSGGSSSSSSNDDDED